MAARISDDWQRMYGHPVYFLETFVDPERFRGTCYRAANRVLLDKTTGRGKQSNSYVPNRTRIALPGAKYSDGTGTKLTPFWREAVHSIEAIPGVESAAVTSELPLSGLNNPTPRMATSPEGKSQLLYLRSVSPNYWNVMRIPLRAGRFLTPDDRKTAPRVVVISERFSKDVFGDQDPVGQKVTFDFQERAETENYQAVVVGVVGDVRP